MKPTRMALLHILAACAAIVAARPALALQESQPRKDPHSDPGLSDPSLEDEITGHRRAGAPLPPIPPASPKQAQRPVPSVPPPVVDAPGLSGLDIGLPRRRFYAEGSFLAPHEGRLIRARTGDLIFVPAPGEGPPDPAMVVMNCQRMGQLDAAAAAPAFSGLVSLSGQVFVYRDRHYLLPTVFAVRSSKAEAVAPAPESGAKPGPQPADVRAEDLIKELESHRAPRVAEPPRTPPPEAKQEESPTPKSLLPEGTVLVMRRGRLVKVGDGRLAFALDNGPSSPPTSPLILLPCGQMQQLETLAATRGDDLAYKVSGRVFVYQERNYLLVTMHQVSATGEIVPLQ
jgi:hypothetical protein